MGMATSRGIRNNNPGNIDRSPTNKWQGRMPREQMTDAQRAESRFEVFSTPAWGIRALCVLLINYQDKHGLHNVRGFIGRWAPPTENNTDAYVQQVAQAVGVDPEDFINLHEYRRLRPMVEAIIKHENGVQPYSSDVVEEGLRLAGVVKPGGAPLVALPKATTTAAVTAATVGGAGAIAEVVQQVTPAMQQLMPVVQQANTVAQSTAGLPPWLRLVIALGLLVAAGASIYTWWRLRRAHKAVQA
jgi:hypothetical protein